MQEHDDDGFVRECIKTTARYLSKLAHRRRLLQRATRNQAEVRAIGSSPRTTPTDLHCWVMSVEVLLLSLNAIHPKAREIVVRCIGDGERYSDVAADLRMSRYHLKSIIDLACMRFVFDLTDEKRRDELDLDLHPTDAAAAA